MNSEYRKDKRYGRVYGKAVLTPPGAFSWPSLEKPKDPPPPAPGQAVGQPRYEVTLLLRKDVSDEFYKTMSHHAAGMLKLYNEGNPAKLASVDVFKDGDQSDHEKYPFNKGHWILIARSTQAPVIKDANLDALPASAIKGGCTGRLVVTPHLGPTGISYRIERVQLLADDGTRFAGAREDYDAMLGGEETETQVEEADAMLAANGLVAETAVHYPPQGEAQMQIPAVMQTPAPQPSAPQPAAPLTPAQMRAQIAEAAQKKNVGGVIKGGKGIKAAGALL